MMAIHTDEQIADQEGRLNPFRALPAGFCETADGIADLTIAGNRGTACGYREEVDERCRYAGPGEDTQGDSRPGGYSSIRIRRRCRLGAAYGVCRRRRSADRYEMGAQEIRPDQQSQRARPEVELQVANRKKPAGKPGGAQRRVLGDMNAISIHSEPRCQLIVMHLQGIALISIKSRLLLSQPRAFPRVVRCMPFR